MLSWMVELARAEVVSNDAPDLSELIPECDFFTSHRFCDGNLNDPRNLSRLPPAHSKSGADGDQHPDQALAQFLEMIEEGHLTLKLFLVFGFLFVVIGVFRHQASDPAGGEFGGSPGFSK